MAVQRQWSFGRGDASPLLRRGRGGRGADPDDDDGDAGVESTGTGTNVGTWYLRAAPEPAADATPVAGAASPAALPGVGRSSHESGAAQGTKYRSSLGSVLGTLRCFSVRAATSLAALAGFAGGRKVQWPRALRRGSPPTNCANLEPLRLGVDVRATLLADEALANAVLVGGTPQGPRAKGEAPDTYTDGLQYKHPRAATGLPGAALSQARGLGSSGSPVGRGPAQAQGILQRSKLSVGCSAHAMRMRVQVALRGVHPAPCHGQQS
ncbi:hypothetical protein TARUN_8351 [Trichoderma arundinaceum]|uniref:Uncharacterized protein n=1 Tax=Trichoderma arundinaceum TaxID=490622 RepID=A0A395NCQ2_TRIAR|nr:hypothetical protein TARUN_8351 [Trichoderma arundinaceum]